MGMWIKKIFLAIGNPKLLIGKIASVANSFFYKNKDCSGDIFLVSFPKCGRTWLRVILGKALVDYKNLDKTYEPILTQELFSEFNLGNIVISHDFSDGNTIPISCLKEKKVILLVRDIRDMLVSYYFHTKYRADRFDQDISAFIRNPIYGVDKIIRFYSRWENISSKVELLYIRYEDLHNRPKSTIRGVFEFIGITSINQNLIDNAIEFSNFENMKRMEIGSSFQDGGMKFRGTDDKYRKVRKGRIHGYRNDISKSDEEYIIKRVMDAKMKDLFLHQ